MAKRGFSNSCFRGHMPKTLIQMFSEGKTQAEFCAKHDICEETFYMWCRKYKVFRVAYEVAKVKAKAYYDEMLRENLVEHHKGPRLNTAAFNRMMNTRFNVPEKRRLKIKGFQKGTTIIEKMEAVFDSVGRGLITADEAASLTKMIDVAVKVKYQDELEERLRAVERTSELGVHDKDFKEVSDSDFEEFIKEATGEA